MESVDYSLLTVWCVAGVSFVMQVYLFLTWPTARQAKGAANPTPLPPNQPATEASSGMAASVVATTPRWEPPPDAVLDGILQESPLPSRDHGNAGRRRKTKPSAVSLEQRVVRAGIYRRGAIRAFITFRVVLTLGLVALGSFAAPLASLPTEYALYLGAGAGLAGWLIPSFWLDQQLQSRQTKMRRALPDALDLITVCIQGGLSLPGALSRVARELGPAHPMLATELSIVEREIQMGQSTGDAMFQFAQRFNLEELRSLSSIVGQTEKYGGSIASALKTYAEGLRTKRRQRAEEMAQKAAVKLLFPTLLCIFPGIFVVVLGPTAARMMQVMAEVSWGG